jgi:diaminobutyrate-2-oxoglutarate transaminase
MIAFAAGATALEWMEEHKISERSAALGKKALVRLKEIEATYDIVGEARGLGLMIALEMVTDKKSKTPDSVTAKKIRKYAHQRGVMIEVGGHHNNVARLLPPLVIPENYLMKGIDIIESVIKDLSEGKLD